MKYIKVSIGLIGMSLLSSNSALFAQNSTPQKGDSQKLRQATMAVEAPGSILKDVSIGTMIEQSLQNAEFYVNSGQKFADLEILRYKVPGWNELSAKQKEFAYYLSQAALSGRDIIYDQRGKYNLTIRKTLEAIWGSHKIDKAGDQWDKFKEYSGRFWFSNGIHHHYANDKFVPECNTDYFAELVRAADVKKLPLQNGESIDAFISRMTAVVFDPTIEPKMVNLSANVDNVKESYNNYYRGVTQKEVEEFYAKFPHTGHDPEWGLNSQLVKNAKGELEERVWKSGGMYGAAIDQMIFWITKAIPLAENEQQAKALKLLVEYYRTGDLKLWDEYSIAWVQVTEPMVDFTHGFIEVYSDAAGIKGSYEGIVSIRDEEATKRIHAIAEQAQWFEDNSPIANNHKKKEVKGISAKAINVVMEAGDAAPSTPIGINLPNSDWLRKEYGSKSVTISNITHSYSASSASGGFLDEFVIDPEEKARAKKYGSLAGDLHTDMHECIGHASGQINPGVATPDKTLKSYASTLEEARADLVGLYYAIDPKLVEIGVMPTLDVGRAEYDSYMRNGLMTQLTRLKLGDEIEEAHMRNRALVAYWAYEKGKKDNVVSFLKVKGKTYVQINDYNKLRNLFGQLLKEIQRIKSEGDYEAGKKLVETYGVKVNQELHKEVLERFASLKIKPYKGFIQPKLVPVVEGNKMVDVKIEYPTDFFEQMLQYGKEFDFLPAVN